MCDESDTGNERQEELEWSDIECMKIAAMGSFPVSVQDLTVQKQVITRFLRFYLGGRRDKRFGVDDLVIAVLAIMPFSPYNENVVWSKSQFSDDGTLFFLSAEEKLAANVKESYQTEEQDQKNIIEQESEKQKEVGTESVCSKEDSIYSDHDYYNDLMTDFDMADTGLLSETSSLNSTISTFNQINKMLVDQGILLNDNNDVADLERSTIWQNIKFDPKPLPQNYAMINYGPVENAAFISFCNTALDNWDNDSVSRTVLKSFFAVVALVLMRATAKSYKHLASTFHSVKFLRFLRHMEIVAPAIRYVPPHKRCLKGAFRTFRRKSTNTPIMFAKLIFLREGTTNRYLKYVVSNALLNYTADYGLNLVILWQSIHTSVSTEDVERIVELTTCDETRASWETLTSFLFKYKTSTCKESAYRWARILDARYFRELSCQANYALAVVLAVFAEGILGNTGIWNATWVKNDDEEDRLKKLGSQLYEQYLHLKIM